MTEKDFFCLTPFIIIAIAPVVIMIVISLIRNYKVVYGFSVLSLLAAFGSIFFVLPSLPHTIDPLFIIDVY
jgi:NADH-quinone oxidoreductase subunit N